MSAVSQIEWTDATFNPWVGCSKVSCGCNNCYAEHLMDHRLGRVMWGVGQPRVRMTADYWEQPLAWNRAVQKKPLRCAKCGVRRGLAGEWICECGGALVPSRRLVFCASLADFLDPEVPIEWFVDLMDLIRQTPFLQWLLLTKRPHLFSERMEDAYLHAIAAGRAGWEDVSGFIWDWSFGPPAHVSIGVSVENQSNADMRIPQLLAIPAATRFLSVEPMLGQVRINEWMAIEWGETVGQWIEAWPGRHCYNEARLHWVICGGESGPATTVERAMRAEWARDLKDQCVAAALPFFFKQWGEFVPVAQVGGIPLELEFLRLGKKAAGRMLDGREWSEFPREFNARPEVAV